MDLTYVRCLIIFVGHFTILLLIFEVYSVSDHLLLFGAMPYLVMYKLNYGDSLHIALIQLDVRWVMVAL